MSSNLHAHMGFTQFELSKFTLKNLNKFNLSPTGKLVLLALVDCYNPKNEEIYPKQQTIANQLGISPSSVKRAVKELADAQIIIYEFKTTNRYRLTSTFYNLIDLEKKQNTKLTPEKVQNNPTQCSKLTPSYIEQKKEQKKNNNIFPFKNFQNEPKYVRPEETRKLLDKIESDKKTCKSPYDDRECAVSWLNSLDENDLRHSFIKERADKIKKLWKLQ